jgi:hypothetical protein
MPGRTDVEYAMVMEVSVKHRKACTPREMDQVITNQTSVLTVFVNYLT